MFPFVIDLLDGWENVVSQQWVRGSCSTALVAVGRDVPPVALQIAQAVTGHHQLLSAFLLNDLDAFVVGIRTLVAPVVAPVKVVETTARVRAHTAVAPDAKSISE